jgi:hypothetical protein
MASGVDIDIKYKISGNYIIFIIIKMVNNAEKEVPIVERILVVGLADEDFSKLNELSQKNSLSAKTFLTKPITNSLGK